MRKKYLFSASFSLPFSLYDAYDDKVLTVVLLKN